ncbi:uncharacterized protein LOC129927755 [Biomphalaria glabrata]|uniref:Uncharacterized protein LOC129927755 n=1 Tax=Biomphalaria glabrata TaxID=6526 RepID=A0A9W3B4K8_BIOGL|nr:uncharacterized protein LOC129927755 [Biomphalaria glabrata]
MTKKDFKVELHVGDKLISKLIKLAPQFLNNLAPLAEALKVKPKKPKDPVNKMSPGRKSQAVSFISKYDLNILVVIIFIAASVASIFIDLVYGVMLFTEGLLMLGYFNSVRIIFLLPFMLASLGFLIYLSVESFCVLAIHYLFLITVVWIQSRFIK